MRVGSLSPLSLSALSSSPLFRDVPLRSRRPRALERSLLLAPFPSLGCMGSPCPTLPCYGTRKRAPEASTAQRANLERAPRAPPSLASPHLVLPRLSPPRLTSPRLLLSSLACSRPRRERLVYRFGFRSNYLQRCSRARAPVDLGRSRWCYVRAGGRR